MIRSMIRSILILSVTSLVLFTSSCTKEKASDEAENSVEQTEEDKEAEVWENAPKEEDENKLPPEKEILVLRDSIEASWQTIIVKDDEKFAKIRSLVKQMKAEGVPNAEEEGRKITTLLTAAEALRLERADIDDVSKIDAYDDATAKVIDQIKAAAEANDGFSKAATSNLMKSQIIGLDNNDFIRRKSYNDLAKTYNELLESNKDNFSTLGDEYTSLKVIKLFSFEQAG